MSQRELTQEITAQAERSYDRLEGEWHDWLEVARRYEHKVPHQDRQDIRHDIILELYRARVRDDKPLPILRAYRIASLTVALYWRQQAKFQTRVCIYNGVAENCHCQGCSHKPKQGRCAYQALRPIQSLDQPTTDYEGSKCRLLDTVADDKAIDLDLQLDAGIWLLGCPMRLIEVARKKLEGKALNEKDRQYLSRYRRQTQKSLL